MQSPKNLVNESYVLQITDCLRHQNMETLRDLLDNFPDRDEKTRVRALFEISVSSNNNAFFALNHLIDKAPPSATYKNDLVELLLDKAQAHAPFILPFIDHASPGQQKNAVPVFASILLSETDTHILQKVLMAIGKTGEKSCINVVADFIFYDHEGLKRAAISALGGIGGPSAIKRLAFASQTSKSDAYLVSTLERLIKQLSLDDPNDNPDAKQLASRKDTLEGLTEDSDMAQLIIMLNSNSPHERHLAIDSLIDIGPRVIPAVSANIDLSNVDSIINGLDILGNIRHEAALPSILKILSLHHPDSNVRFSAYEAISKLSRLHSSVSLIDGVTDASEQVRLAAATAINSNPSDVILSGLKSKIETSGRRSKRALIIAAIIDSHADHIFSSLMDSDSFVFHAMEYIAQSHHSTVSFFKDILIRRGTRSLANSIISQVRKPEKNKPSLTIFCVDDSLICLKYYIRLFHSMGHQPFVFEDPDAAWVALQKHKPDLVTTDLNMISMNGLQLAEKIRSLYSISELPIVVITTQKDFILSFQSIDTSRNHPDNNTMMKINHAIHKPLEFKSIKPQIDRIT